MTHPTGPDPHWDYANGILKNVRGLTDHEKLDKLERAQAFKALSRLEEVPVRGSFDKAHLQEIHRRIFESVYPWAGELRQINFSRAASYPFAMVQFMQGNIDKTFAELASENHLKGLDAEAFAGRAGHYLGELNTLHAFREGNGRTQREFIRELAAEAGHHINWARVSREQMYEASSQSHNQGNNAGLTAVIRASIEPPKVFAKRTEPGQGTAHDRKKIADEAHLLLRSTSGHIRDVPIHEGTLSLGGRASGWALAKSQQHVAIVTSANQFLVLHRSLMSKDVELGQKVQLEMKKDRAVVRTVERGRGR